MKQANQDIRAEAKRAGVFFWRIAEALGVHEITLSKQMRHELPEERKAEIREAINTLREA